MPKPAAQLSASSYTVQRGADGRADTLAAREIDLAVPRGRQYALSTIGHSKNRHTRSWQWVDRIGEVHYAVHRGAKVAGYSKLYAHKLNPDGSIGDRIDRGLAANIVNMLQSPYGGLRGFVERFYMMMKVPGDTYLIRTRDDAGNVNGYDWCSSSELDINGLSTIIAAGDRERVVRPGDSPIRRITLPNSVDGVLSEEIRREDFLGRVWRPQGQYIEMPDSPMRALDLECDLLYTLTLGLKAKLLNRLTLNGLMLVSKSITDVRSSAPKAESNEFHGDSVLNDMVSTMTYMASNPEEPAAAMPIVLSATANGNEKLADMVHLITTDRQIWETDIHQRKELIDRLLTGLDVQPQHVRGLGDANHWSAWAVSDDERRVNIQPDVELMCWALTRLVLNREMLAAGRKPSEILRTVIWYDLTDANVKTNLAEDSRQMYDRGLTSDESTRRMSGLNETDAPTDEERIRWFGQKYGNPYMATFGLPGAGSKPGDKLDWTKVSEFMGKGNGPAQDSGAEPPKSTPGKGAPVAPKPKPAASLESVA